MIDVEHCGLTALKQNILVGLDGLVQFKCGVCNHRRETLGVRKKFLDGVINLDGRAVVNLGEQVVLGNERAFDLLTQNAFVK